MLDLLPPGHQPTDSSSVSLRGYVCTQVKVHIPNHVQEEKKEKRRKKEKEKNRTEIKRKKRDKVGRMDTHVVARAALGAEGALPVGLLARGREGHAGHQVHVRARPSLPKQPCRVALVLLLVFVTLIFVLVLALVGPSGQDDPVKAGQQGVGGPEDGRGGRGGEGGEGGSRGRGRQGEGRVVVVEAEGGCGRGGLQAAHSNGVAVTQGLWYVSLVGQVSFPGDEGKQDEPKGL